MPLVLPSGRAEGHATLAVLPLRPTDHAGRVAGSHHTVCFVIWTHPSHLSGRSVCRAPLTRAGRAPGLVALAVTRALSHWSCPWSRYADRVSSLPMLAVLPFRRATYSRTVVRAASARQVNRLAFLARSPSR